MHCTPWEEFIWKRGKTNQDFDRSPSGGKARMDPTLRQPRSSPPSGPRDLTQLARPLAPFFCHLVFLLYQEPASCWCKGICRDGSQPIRTPLSTGTSTQESLPGSRDTLTTCKIRTAGSPCVQSYSITSFQLGVVNPTPGRANLWVLCQTSRESRFARALRAPSEAPGTAALESKKLKLFSARSST